MKKEKKVQSIFSLWKKAKYNAKTCYKLIDNSVEYTNPHKILEVQKTFYDDLYQEEKDVNFDLKNNYNIKVPEEIKQEQCDQITISDLEKAIKTMNNNKTPGEDGIPVDFYKVFWTKLKSTFYEMMVECYENKLLHQNS